MPRCVACASSRSSNMGRDRSGRSFCPTWGPRSSRSRIRRWEETSVAMCRPDSRGRTACSSRPSIGASAVSPSAYGRTGERSTQPGYDALVQAEAGWAALTGEPDGPPVKSGLSLVDYSAGLMAALGLMAGVFDAQRTGRGRNIDTNLYDVALALLTYPATWYLTQGVVTERLPNSAHPSIVPFQFFATADGQIAIACAKEKFFKNLAAAIQLAPDARFATFESRRQNRQALP